MLGDDDENSNDETPVSSLERPAALGDSFDPEHGRLPDPVMQHGWTSTNIENALDDMLQKRAMAYEALQDELETRDVSAAAAQENLLQAQHEIAALRRKVATYRHFEGLYKASQEENRLLWTYVDRAKAENGPLKETLHRLEKENKELCETVAFLKAMDEAREEDRSKPADASPRRLDGGRGFRPSSVARWGEKLAASSRLARIVPPPTGEESEQSKKSRCRPHLGGRRAHKALVGGP